MGLFSKAAAIGGLVAFARSDSGKKLVAKAKVYANDPKTRQQLLDLKRRYLPGR